MSSSFTFMFLSYFSLFFIQGIFRVQVVRTVNTKLYSSNVIDPPDEDLIVIPRPKSRENEPIKQRKAR